MFLLSSFKSLTNWFWSKVVSLLWIIRIAVFTLISTFVTTSETSISLINLSTWKCHPFLRQCATFEVQQKNVSLSSSVLTCLHFSRIHESFCFVKHVVSPKSPRTDTFEVLFPTARKYLAAFVWTLLITLCERVPPDSASVE